MELRDRLNSGLKAAMRDKDALRLGTLRLINAAIKDQDIALRPQSQTVGNAEITAILAKMVKQRLESARAYEEAGRLELAQQEQDEIKVIEEFLPRQLSETEVEAAVSGAISETGASSLRDMGRVMAVLKDRHPGQMDFGKVGPMVKARLA
ncbi:GatB/YqeY domain-containing protein [Jannaschia formosa]|uniref:GatB/YqeY domain-containing protein n=1 Tax=Jannaschia formosa TaxID=2259592 RepID=UPI000E1C0E2D|nr:GatB/YqeY domain-containing protein [Jannaschia formosa]TFL17441.1 GatB/YqeY domain-containing protein [Jannaschia formosa]